MDSTPDAPKPASTVNPFQYPTFEHAALLIQADKTIEDETARNKRASDLRSFQKLSGLLPTDRLCPDVVRKVCKDVNHVAAKVGKGRWRNVKASARWALGHLGLTKTPIRSQCSRLPEWEPLYQALKPHTAYAAALSRLVHYLSANKIVPSAVTEANLSAFHLALKEAGFPKANLVYRQACKYWNQASAVVPAWPALQVTIPSFVDDEYSLPSEMLPTLTAQTEQYIAFRKLTDGGDDLLKLPNTKKGAVLTEEGAERVRYYFRQLGSCLVHRGWAPANVALQSLADPPTLLDAVRFLIGRIRDRALATDPSFQASEKELIKNAQIYTLVCSVCSMARTYLKVPEPTLEQLKALRRNSTPPKSDEKILADLQPFLEPANAIQFYRKPDVILSSIQAKTKKTSSDARLLMYALWWRLETRLPLRLSDSLSLKLKDHLVWVGSLESAPFRLHLPNTAKGGKAVDIALPNSVAKLLRPWLTEYRPLLAEDGSPYLFPGEGAGPRNATAFGDGMRTFMKDHLHFSITRHAYRHLATYMYLKACPGDFHGASTLLGHASVVTTMKYYDVLRKLTVWDTFDKFLLGIEEGGHAG